MKEYVYIVEEGIKPRKVRNLLMKFQDFLGLSDEVQSNLIREHIISSLSGPVLELVFIDGVRQLKLSESDLGSNDFKSLIEGLKAVETKPYWCI